MAVRPGVGRVTARRIGAGIGFALPPAGRGQAFNADFPLGGACSFETAPAPTLAPWAIRDLRARADRICANFDTLSTLARPMSVDGMFGTPRLRLLAADPPVATRCVSRSTDHASRLCRQRA
jgi:hypothetical protein